jgi:hypothetical protein
MLFDFKKPEVEISWHGPSKLSFSLIMVIERMLLGNGSVKHLILLQCVFLDKLL